MRRARPWWWLLPVLVLAPLGMALGEARNFIIHSAEMRVNERVYLLDVNVGYRFSADALDALDNGVPLPVQLEIEVTRARWWWWDEQLASLTQDYQLHYHALTERYVVKNLNSGAQETFARLRFALEALGRVRGLPILDAKLLPPGDHVLRVRAALNVEALPAPLRPMAYLLPQWRMASPWYEWPFTS